MTGAAVEIEWRYRGNPDDRVLVLLPPLETAAVVLENPDLCLHYRKTLTNLCTTESLKYILVYVPFFDPSQYDQRCLFERLYGRELRLLSSLDKLLDRDYPEYMTNECLYTLANASEWDTTTLPMEWFFDTVINDQLFEYYDSTSRWLGTDLKKYADLAIGAGCLYETMIATLYLLNDTAQDTDLVFVLGDIDTEAQSAYVRVIRSLVGHRQVSGLYSYGNLSPVLEEFKEEKEIRCKFYDTMNPVRYDGLMTALKQFNLSYTKVLWLGAFRHDAPDGASEPNGDSDEHTEPPELRPKTVRGYIYSPVAWATLFPRATTGDAQENEAGAKGGGTGAEGLIALLTGGGGGAPGQKNAPKAPVFTYEPLGLLDFFLKESN